MAITFPRNDIITVPGIITNAFELVPRQQIARRGNGQAIVQDLGDPIWKAAFASPNIGQDDCVDLIARLNSLDGGLQLFNATDTRRAYPRLYPTGVFTDTATVLAVASITSLSFTGLPASFKISVGDYFHYGVSGRRFLHQIMEANTASAGGVSGTVEVRPALSGALTGGTSVTFKTPSCRMSIEPGSIQYTDAGRTLGNVSFKAVENW